MAAKRSVDVIRQFADQLTKANTFDTVIRKMKITGGGNGKCLAEFQLDQADLNMRGGIHGGFIATIMDNITSYALMSTPLQPVKSVDMQIMFMRSALTGEELVAEAKTISYENNLAYVECEIRGKSDGSLVAKGGQTKTYNEIS